MGQTQMVSRWIFVLGLLMLSSVGSLAQTPITIHSTILGNLNKESPIAIYSLQGEENDIIIIQAIALVNNFDLSITIQNGTEILATSDIDPLTVNSMDARLDYRIPMTDTYLILISSPVQQTGDFVLKVSGLNNSDSIQLDSQSVEVELNNDPQSYSLTASSGDVLHLRSESTNTEFYATVFGVGGQLIYQALGTSAQVNLPETGDYDVLVRPVAPTDNNIVTLSLAGDTNPIDPVITTATPIPPPTTTVPVYATPVLDRDNLCSVFSGGFPNIRVSPSTDTAVITQIQPDTVYTVVGIYTNWYQILGPTFGSGWVRNDVVGIGGDCADVSAVSPNNTPIVPTSTPTMPIPTATPTLSPTPTQLPTETFTPSPTVFVEIAPNDNEFNNPLNVPLGNTVSVSDFVSFPDGDREDKVMWDVTGLSEEAGDEQAQLVIIATCFGNEGSLIDFVIGDTAYECGDTIVDEIVTTESKSGMVTITAISGDDSYVQWVLTGTATRLEDG